MLTNIHPVSCRRVGYHSEQTSANVEKVYKHMKCSCEDTGIIYYDVIGVRIMEIPPVKVSGMKLLQVAYSQLRCRPTDVRGHEG